jgi:hypothetical protein
VHVIIEHTKVRLRFELSSSNMSCAEQGLACQPAPRLSMLYYGIGLWTGSFSRKGGRFDAGTPFLPVEAARLCARLALRNSSGGYLDTRRLVSQGCDMHRPTSARGGEPVADL